MAYENFTRKELLLKIADLEHANFELQLMINRGSSEKDRTIRHIHEYAEMSPKYRTPYNCGRIF